MYSSVDTIWVLLGAALVFFMQAGFAMVETGLTRAKNAGNIIMKNLMDFALGTVAFWLAGFGIMFAGDGALIGGFDPFILGDYSSTFPSWAFVIFQTVFCATAATIVSGAMAERTKFLSYCIYSVAISHRQIYEGRQGERHPGPQPYIGRAGLLYPVVLLVRLQRLLHRFDDGGRDIGERQPHLRQYQPGRSCGNLCGDDHYLEPLQKARRLDDAERFSGRTCGHHGRLRRSGPVRRGHYRADRGLRSGVRR